MSYNGHKNYNFWNVSLWLDNDEGLYSLKRRWLRKCRNRDEAARFIIEALSDMGLTHTPDGAPYSFSAVRAALKG